MVCADAGGMELKVDGIDFGFFSDGGTWFGPDEDTTDEQADMKECYLEAKIMTPELLLALHTMKEQCAGLVRAFFRDNQDALASLVGQQEERWRYQFGTNEDEKVVAARRATVMSLAIGG